MSTKPVTAIERSMDGLREMLFDTIDKLRCGTIDRATASATAQLSMTLIKSVEVQMNWEKAKLDNKVPRALPAMPLLPMIAPRGAT